MKIFVLGWYGHRNCGDESYKTAIPLLFPGHDFVFGEFISEKDVEANDIFILGGGNVFKPSFLSELKKVKDKPIYGFSIGVEKPPPCDVPFRHIWAREHHSVATLQKMGISASFLPDAAFILHPSPSAGRAEIERRFAGEQLDLYDKVTAIVVNSYLINGTHEANPRQAMQFLTFSYDLAKAIDETSSSFIFLPFGTILPADDRISNGWVASKCKFWKKNKVIFDRFDTQQTLDIISACDMMVSSRLHSSVFAFSAGVPLVDITHHSKNENFLKTTGTQDGSISFWDFSAARMVSKMKTYLQKPKHQDAERFRNILKDGCNAIRFTE